MKFSALLFDLDGTLVETIHLYGEAMIRTFSRFGIEIDEADFLAMYHRGTSIDTLLREFLGQEADVSEARSVRDAEYIRLLEERSEWIAGALDVLEASKDVPRAIVTKSWQSYVSAIDRKLGVLEHFDTVITAEHMKPYFKPHPHGFLVAADKLGVSPSDCLVIGDQLFDIEGAKNAGMQSILVCGAHTPKEARECAMRNVGSLEGLIDFLHPLHFF